MTARPSNSRASCLMRFKDIGQIKLSFNGYPPAAICERLVRCRHFGTAANRLMKILDET